VVRFDVSAGGQVAGSIRTLCRRGVAARGQSPATFNYPIIDEVGGLAQRRAVTVGIVSALWKEAAAMRLLVEDLQPVPVKPNDRNQYQEGWLPSTDSGRPHGVVLALLPRTVSATPRRCARICSTAIRRWSAW
jgi:hypothetical protein